MAYGPKLQLRQTQSLVLTPQLMQSIRLLQFSYLELQRFVEEEIERNPLLDRTGEDAGTEPVEAAGTEPDRSPEQTDWTSEAMAAELDTSLENVFPDDPGSRDPLPPDLGAQWKSSAASGAGSSETFDPGSLIAAKVGLADHVDEQIAFAFADPVQRLIARALAGELDDAGYLRSDLAEMAGRLGVTMHAIAEVLSICQTFEPAGLFARDLKECLALQLAGKDRLDPAMAILLDNLELLARRDFAALKRLCGVDRADLIDMLAEIRALDPKPGNLFSQDPAAPVVPDVMVRAAPDGGWSVELNPDTLPRVLVDQAYYARVAGRTKDVRESEFLGECLQNANWLARSLDQRAKTILKVAIEIVRQQDGFFRHGVAQLRPLNLKTVADAIGMHESTVSRVTSNKAIGTGRGTFEMKYFFTAAIPGAAGAEAHSSEAVRHRIKQLVDTEPADGVLSDDALVRKLKAEGVDIARRTVAKYRESLRIPSSVERRRLRQTASGA